MLANPSSPPTLSVEDREVLERMQDLLRRFERMPETTLPYAEARVLARGLLARKYIRISKHRADAYGPESQNEDIAEACDLEGFHTPLEGYEDHITGSGRLVRHDFDRMRNDAHDKKFGLLMVGRMDRFSRNITMGMLQAVELILAGVYVYFCDEKIIAGLDHNWREVLERKLSDAAAQLRVITANNRKTIRTRRRKGHWIGRAPFGWQMSADRLVLSQHPEEWPVVARMIALLREDKLSMQGIADKINEEGFHNRAGLPIRKHFVHSCLRHPLLKGYWPINRSKAGRLGYEEIKKFDGPLTEGEYQEIGEQLAGRADAHQPPEAIKRDYVLLKLLRCGETDSETGKICDVRLYGVTSRRRDKNATWYANYFHPPFKGCSKSAKMWQVSERHLVSQIDALFAQARLPTQAVAVIESYRAIEHGVARVDRAVVRRRFKDELERADLGFRHGAYGEDPREALAKWQQDRVATLTKLASLEQDAPPPSEEVVQHLRDLPELWAAGATAERRQLLRALFVGIRVVRDIKLLPSGKPRARNQRRISQIDPRPEYAELVGLAFSGSMSGSRPSGLPGPTIDMGQQARDFIVWVQTQAA